MDTDTQRHTLLEKQKARLERVLQEQERERTRATEETVASTLRRNSETPEVLRMRGLSVSTDLSKIPGEMVWTKAWYLSADGCQPILSSKAQYHNRREGGGWVSQRVLENLGVVYLKLPPNDLTRLDEICAERGYCRMDVADLDMKAENKKLLEKWFMEHFHANEEMRFVRSGSGYYDFRDSSNDFIRVHLSPGDLLIIPAGMYHRGCLDQNQSISILRLYRDPDEPEWSPIFRNDPGAQTHPARAAYLSSRKRGSVLEDMRFIR